eukprot:COSAG02_NODE_13925_length_1330_cov_1.461413_3_plen_200_part_00
MHAEYGIFVYTIWPLFGAAPQRAPNESIRLQCPGSIATSSSSLWIGAGRRPPEWAKCNRMHSTATKHTQTWEALSVWEIGRLAVFQLATTRGCATTVDTVLEFIWNTRVEPRSLGRPWNFIPAPRRISHDRCCHYERVALRFFSNASTEGRLLYAWVVYRSSNLDRCGWRRIVTRGKMMVGRARFILRQLGCSTVNTNR